MVYQLPSKPNLNQLKNQAKDLLHKHTQGDEKTCKSLRLLHRFTESSDQEILSSEIALHEVQFALAMEYGFKSWGELKHHVESLACSNLATIKQENKKVWIANVPSLSWAKSGQTTFAGALASALSVTEQPYSYEKIMGYSGLAFRVRWAPRNQIWCPSIPVGEFPEEIEAVSWATGWKFVNVNHLGQESNPHMEQYSAEMVTSIDCGRPIVGYGNDLNVAVAFGYKNEGKTFLWWDYFKGNEPIELSGEKTGPWLLFLDGFGMPPEKKERIRRSLNIAVGNWHRSSKDPENGKYHYEYGKNALQRWCEDLVKANSLPEEQKKSLFFLNWWNFAVFADARKAASSILFEYAEQIESSVKGYLQKAAQSYGQAANLMHKTILEKDCFLGPWSGKELKDWDASIQQREQDLLSEILRIESISIDEIIRALDKMESLKF